VEGIEKSGATCVPPLITNQLGPGSLDLRIGKICSFKEAEKRKRYGLHSPPPLKRENLDKGFCLEPEQAILVTTMERISLPSSPRAVGWLTNKSSLARKGLSVSTQMIDPGHDGTITFLLQNLNSFSAILNRGDRIAQMVMISAKNNPYAWYRTGPSRAQERIPGFETLTLGNEFGVFKEPDKVENTIEKSFLLKPGQFVLGITEEEVYLESNDVVGMLIRTNAHFRENVYVLEGLLNPGFKGKIVLEIKNGGHAPVRLFPGEDIYRIFYCPAFTFGSYDKSPKSKYVGTEKTNRPQL